VIIEDTFYPDPDTERACLRFGLWLCLH